MKNILKFVLPLVAFSTLNTYASPISVFSDLKNKFVKGIDINGVIEIEKCSSVSDPSKTPNSYSNNGYKTLHSSFSSIGGYHTIEEKTSTESITFVLNQRALAYDPSNSTTPLSPISLISELSINDRDEIFLIYGSNRDSSPENIGVFKCEWDGLSLNSIE